jgi:hypothetical protein
LLAVSAARFDFGEMQKDVRGDLVRAADQLLGAAEESGVVDVIEREPRAHSY